MTARILWMATALGAVAGSGCASDDAAERTGVAALARAQDADGCEISQLLVVGSDFTGGASAAVLDLVTGTVMALPEPPEADVVPTRLGCTGALLGRGAATLSLLSGSAAAPTLATPTALGAEGDPPYARNPQTIRAVGSDRAYVVQQAQNALAVGDLRAGAPQASIDLTPLVQAADEDGLVDASDLIVIGERAYLALGNYWFDDQYAIHFAGSSLGVVDVTTDSLVDMDPVTDGTQGIPLAYPNPWRGLHHDAAGGRLIVAASGAFDARDGALEVIDLSVGESRGAIVTEEALGGEIGGFAWVSSERLYLLRDRDVVAVNPATGAVGEVIASDMDGLHLHGGLLLTWSRTGESAGLHAFDAASGRDLRPDEAPWSPTAHPVVGIVSIP